MKKLKVSFFLVLMILLIQILMPKAAIAAEERVTIQFSDTNLYNAITSQLASKIESKVSASRTVVMTRSNVNSITSLTITGRGINYVTGIDKFTNLQTLNLSNNSINNINPLGSLRNLRNLNLSNNRVVTVDPLNTCTVLDTLYLQNNDIYNIGALSRLVSLKVLNIDNNHISDISALRSLTNMTTLSASNNTISDMSPVNSLLKLTSTNLKNQTLKYNVTSTNVANNTSSVEMPELFKQAKQSGSKIYTASDFAFQSGSLNSSNSQRVNLASGTYGQATTKVTIKGGNADGSTVEYSYKNVYLSMDTLTSSPTTIQEGAGGTISFIARAFGEDNMNKVTVSITRNSATVAGVVVNKQSIDNTSCRFNVSIPASAPAGTNYTIEVNYDGRRILTRTFTIAAKAATAVQSVSLNKSETTIGLNNTERLIANVYPSDSYNKSVTWSSSNSNVATVDSSGNVRAVGVGSALITVRTVDGGKTANCTVIVPNPVISVTGVAVSPPNLNIKVGDTYQLISTVSPSNATNKNIVWSSNNTNIVTVNSNGAIIATGVGEALVTVRTEDGGHVATCSVYVASNVVNVTSVALNTSNVSLKIGQTSTLMAIVNPSNATNKNVAWVSSNTGVATVDGNGVVKAVGSGSATITVKTVDGGHIATCTITVPNETVPVTNVTLNGTAGTMDIGSTKQLVATVRPSNATNKSVTWSSSNSNVATVDSTGLVTAKAEGTTTITAKTVDGGKIATCIVTVRPKEEIKIPVTGLKLNKTELELKVGAKEKLVVTVNPSNATNKQVQWSAAQNGVVEISEDGVVTALKEGSTYIIVTSLDSSTGVKTARCDIKVTKNAEEPIETITSEKYEITNNQIKKISPLTDREEFLKNISTDYTAKIYDTKGNEVPDGRKVGTGMVLKLSKGSIVKEYVLIVTGDLNGDGNVTGSDLIKIKRHIVKLELLKGPYLVAGDTNGNSDVTGSDLIMIKRHIVKLIKL